MLALPLLPLHVGELLVAFSCSIVMSLLQKRFLYKFLSAWVPSTDFSPFSGGLLSVSVPQSHGCLQDQLEHGVLHGLQSGFFFSTDLQEVQKFSADFTTGQRSMANPKCLLHSFLPSMHIYKVVLVLHLCNTKELPKQRKLIIKFSFLKYVIAEALIDLPFARDGSDLKPGELHKASSRTHTNSPLIYYQNPTKNKSNTILHPVEK